MAVERTVIQLVLPTHVPLLEHEISIREHVPTKVVGALETHELAASIG
jgi:hypothetical protein